MSRFAGFRRHGHDAVAPLGAADLLLFDFRSAPDEEAERVAEERARSLAVSAPFLGASHILWGVVLVGALIADGAAAHLARILLPLAGVLLLDLGLGHALDTVRRRRALPHVTVRVTALYVLLSAALWSLVIAAASEADGGSIVVRAALVAGIGAAIPAYFAVPGLLILGCVTTLSGIALLNSESPLLGIAAAVGLFLVCLGLMRSRELILAAERRLTEEWQAKKAQRFLADFEESGRGWFWETNADGNLTYFSPSLARQLGTVADGLLGRRLEELLLVEGGTETDGLARTLDFHFSARFPFEDVIVRAHSSDDVWWTLSGSPNFDNYGRFLGFRGIGGNLSEQRRSEAEASKLARYDSLTGLPNRAMMRATLDEALTNAAERKRGCALMMIDLDRFKQVNDTLGHPVGDKLLKQVAQRLKSVIGEDGQVGRLGGDEFEAILPGIEEEGRLAALSGRLIDEVSRPYRIEDHEISIGVSVGIAIAQPGKAYASALIKDADVALYAAKDNGRGTFRFFAPEMHAEAAERQILAADLRDALPKGQLRLLYQPLVDSVTEELVAFEALLHWAHPTRGTIPPATIIPLAEECGAMGAIGDWVLRSTCREAAKWPPHVRLAVNLSPMQFADAGLARTVTGALASSGLDADRLELEIMEQVFLADGAVTASTLASLKTLGVRLVLDNFGTGQSGLGHLREAPLDKIKIDRSFVRGAGSAGSRNAAIIRAIVVLAENLRMDTTAEGAETLEELALIRRLGCSQVQGFIFGEPMPGAEALALASQSKPPAEVAGFTRPPRHRLIRTGQLQWDGRTLEVRLRNISAGGAMIECAREIPPETRVKLDLADGGVLGAEVRWSQHGQLGLKFDDEFELRRLARRRRTTSAAAMVTPDYLDPMRQARRAAGPSPLATKRGRK
jgi:diguanylate cyclase (GGDEF)-like protein